MGRSVWQEGEEGLGPFLPRSLFEIFNQIVGVVVSRVESLGVFCPVGCARMQFRISKDP